MKIFVLGRSRTGKSPFAAQVAAQIGATHIMASEWVRREFVPPSDKMERAAFITAITAYSLSRLAQEPRACVDYISKNYDLSGRCVIEGIRSLHDFVHLFDPRVDHVVFLEHDGNELVPTLFERGLVLIDQHVRLQVELGLVSSERVVRYRFPELREDCTADGDGADPVPDSSDSATLVISSLDRCILHYVRHAKGVLGVGQSSSEPTQASVVSMVHAPIKGLRVWVRSEFLHDMDPSFKGKFESGIAFALSSYVGHAPTFKVLLDGGSVFSYLPPHALLTRAQLPDPDLSLEQLVYHNCPASRVALSTFAELKSAKLHVFIKKIGVWLPGEYLFTVDWFEGNDLVHCVRLDNGQLALLPSHKIKFNDSVKEFPGYRKLHAEWTVKAEGQEPPSSLPAS